MRIKKWLLILGCILYMFASFPIMTLAEDEKSVVTKTGKYSMKDEVIYGNLDASGNIQNMYVVNTFYVIKPGNLVDYGKYINVRNLTNLSEIEQKSVNKVHFQAEEGEFYYQGELTNQPLPWDVSITYLLNGKKVQPEKLAGQSGDLEIQITTSANEQVDSIFFDYYLLQISLTLDPKVFQNIQAPEGSEAKEGKNKLITFSVMPKQEEELIVSADVENFEMERIQISAIPANIAMEDPDLMGMKDEMQLLSDAIREIHLGISELTNGIAELHSGATELSGGSSEYLQGIQELDQSSKELVEGSQEIRDVLQQVDEAVQGDIEIPDLDDLQQLPEMFQQLANGLLEYAGLLEQLDEAISNIPDDVISEKQMEAVYATLEEGNAGAEVVDVVKELERSYEQAQIIKEMNQGIVGNFARLTKNMAKELIEIAKVMGESMETMDELEKLTELQEGLSLLSSEFQAFHNGIVRYTGGVNSLATSYEEVDAGIKELTDGSLALENGANELQKGSNKLHESTNDLPSEMQSEIEKQLEEFDFSDFEPASFVSDLNENIDVVQFVLQTEKIEIEETEAAEEETKQEKSFWDRFLDLFRK